MKAILAAVLTASVLSLGVAGGAYAQSSQTNSGGAQNGGKDKIHTKMANKACTGKKNHMGIKKCG